MRLLLKAGPAMLIAAVVAGAAQAQTPEDEEQPIHVGSPFSGEAGADLEGTDTEEPAETGEAPASIDEALGSPAPPPTSYNPSGAYAPSLSAPIDPVTRLPASPYGADGAYAPPPTSYNPSGAYTPSYERPVFPQWSTPVFIDQPGRTPEAPPSYVDQAYEARLRASFLSAQGLKGPLEGGWTLSDAGGARLFDLQLVDSAGGSVEGAWRDLRRPGAIDASGLIVGASRIGNRFNLRFYPQGYGEPVVATLTATADGRWSGELNENGQRRTVYLQRN
jgi:hypothetical protein